MLPAADSGSGQLASATASATAIAAGLGHTCALTSSGGVRCWGNNGRDQIGGGTTSNRLTPVAVSGLSSGVTAIAAGVRHSCALTNAGGVRCWGANIRGALGDGTTSRRPRQVVDVSGLSSGVTAIAAGHDYSCAVTSSADVKCWGYNRWGQLGDGTTSDRSTPVDVSGLSSGVTAISAGGTHSCAPMSSGGVKCWGRNNYGQLGDGTTSTSLTPVDVSGLRGGATAIAAGSFHSCALRRSGGVKCWGLNSTGQLGDGTMSDRRTPVAVVGLGRAKATLAIVSRSVAVTPARVAAVRLRCGSEARCRGTLTLTTSVEGKLVGSSARRVQVRLGSRTFAIAAGRTQTVEAKLAARGFTLLVRVKRLPTQIRLSYQQPAGGTTTATRTITLSAPKVVKR